MKISKISLQRNRTRTIFGVASRQDTRGDTIVEVLVVLAILGLAFGISYATANKSLVRARTSQEHSNAMTIATKQVELLRKSAFEDSTKNVTHQLNQPFCMKPDGQVTTALSNCDVDGLYHVSIEPHKSTIDPTKSNKYTVNVTWDGLASSGSQHAVINYKINGITLKGEVEENNMTLTAPELKVTVKAIRPNPSAASPSCSSSITEDRGGTKVTIRDVSDPAAATISSFTGGNSTATFQNLKYYDSYRISGITPPSPAGRWGVCPLPSDTKLVYPGATPVINAKIYPICNLEPDPNQPIWATKVVYDVPQYQTVYWWEHTGPDWGPYGPHDPHHGPPNLRYGIGPPYIPNYQQYENSVVPGHGVVLARYGRYSGSWYNRFELWSGQKFIGYGPRTVWYISGYRNHWVCP